MRNKINYIYQSYKAISEALGLHSESHCPKKEKTWNEGENSQDSPTHQN